MEYSGAIVVTAYSGVLILAVIVCSYALIAITCCYAFVVYCCFMVYSRGLVIIICGCVIGTDFSYSSSCDV